MIYYFIVFYDWHLDNNVKDLMRYMNCLWSPTVKGNNIKQNIWSYNNLILDLFICMSETEETKKRGGTGPRKTIEIGNDMYYINRSFFLKWRSLSSIFSHISKSFGGLLLHIFEDDTHRHLLFLLSCSSVRMTSAKLNK